MTSSINGSFKNVLIQFCLHRGYYPSHNLRTASSLFNSSKTSKYSSGVNRPAMKSDSHLSSSLYSLIRMPSFFTAPVLPKGFVWLFLNFKIMFGSLSVRVPDAFGALQHRCQATKQTDSVCSANLETVKIFAQNFQTGDAKNCVVRTPLFHTDLRPHARDLLIPYLRFLWSSVNYSSYLPQGSCFESPMSHQLPKECFLSMLRSASETLGLTRGGYTAPTPRYLTAPPQQPPIPQHTSPNFSTYVQNFKNLMKGRTLWLQ